jgi:hypothetical protein
MDLPQNRLLGEHRRASSTMRLSWQDFQRFVVTKVNRCTHRGTLSQPVEVNVDAISILERPMKSIIQQRILVCISSATLHAILKFN